MLFNHLDIEKLWKSTYRVEQTIYRHIKIRGVTSVNTTYFSTVFKLSNTGARTSWIDLIPLRIEKQLYFTEEEFLEGRYNLVEKDFFEKLEIYSGYVNEQLRKMNLPKISWNPALIKGRSEISPPGIRYYF